MLLLEYVGRSFDVFFNDGSRTFELASEIFNRKLVNHFYSVGTDLRRHPEGHRIKAVFFLEQPVFGIEDGNHGLHFRFPFDDGAEHIACRTCRAC
ncbi:MAG: hypothetical protein A2170_08590 [Deltaproteobacteria bacterium RBG_13_53_10]|nr:MAG: hypothetical protein A2170_08590 [Deltaproteobacteria bacterium RBG_13_53_10]